MKKTMHISIKKPETAAPITVSINIPLSVLRANADASAENATAEITTTKSE